MRILQIGQTGQLAQELLKRCDAHGHQVFALGRQDLDLSKPDTVESVLSATGPVDIVIIAAAYTAVDNAEADEAVANAVNAESVEAIGRFAASRGVPVLHVSTDYVFSGERIGHLYQPDDPVGPTGAYGRSKLAGERALAAAAPMHVIVRTAWVYSPFGRNFVKTMLALGRSRDRLTVVSDQTGCPTAAGDLADVLLTIGDTVISDDRSSDLWGTYHYCGAGVTSWYDFAQAIFEEAPDGLTGKPAVEPVPSSSYPTPARRPANSALDCRKLEQNFSVSPREWRMSLRETLAELKRHAHLEPS